MTEPAFDVPGEPLAIGHGVEPGRLARDAIIVTACTLASRLLGFVRVMVAAAVLSNGLLGDTYHASNIVPNLLFELVAGGVLQAFLVPTFVAARREGGDEQLGRTAGVVVASLTALLAAIAVASMAAAPLIARAMTAGEGDPAIAADKLDVMRPMLVVFLPQIVFYGVGMVATAALAAQHRFAAAALAPAVNSIVVITSFVLYWSTRRNEPASLDLDTWQFALLAGGTTLAVISFTSVPGIVLTARGVRWRPRWDPRHPAVVALRSNVGWAVLSVLGTLVPTGAAIVMGYGAPGGVAVFTMSFAFFVLPHALIAVPVATALAPRVADAWQRGRRDTAGELIGRSVQVVVPLLLFAGAALAALAWPIARIAGSFGQAASQGLAPIAHTIAVFGLGLLGYGLAFLTTRVLFNLDDVKQAAILLSASAVVGVAAMGLAAAMIDDHDRAAAVALGYGFAQTVAAVLLTLRVRRLTGAPSWSALGRLGAGSLVAAGVSGVAMFVLQQQFPTDRAGALVSIVVAVIAGTVVFVGFATVLVGVSPRSLLGRPGVR